MTPEDIIAQLGLRPHPEGGYFVETFRDAKGVDGRAHSTAIYYLLRQGEHSHWHHIDAAEVWHWYGGAPLQLMLSDDGMAIAEHRLGPAIDQNERPQLLVPAHVWQSARPLGDWTLVGCTVAPGFDFSTFELAPPGWQPGDKSDQPS